MVIDAETKVSKVISFKGVKAQQNTLNTEMSSMLPSSSALVSKATPADSRKSEVFPISGIAHEADLKKEDHDINIKHAT